MNSPITEEIRAIRHELAARFNNDLGRIVDDLQRQQRESGREYIRLPGRPVSVRHTTNATVAPSDGGTVSPSGNSTPAAD